MTFSNGLFLRRTSPEVKCLHPTSSRHETCSPLEPDLSQRARVDKRVFWPQYFRKIEYVCLSGFRLT